VRLLIVGVGAVTVVIEPGVQLHGTGSGHGSHQECELYRTWSETERQAGHRSLIILYNAGGVILPRSWNASASNMARQGFGEVEKSKSCLECAEE